MPSLTRAPPLVTLASGRRQGEPNYRTMGGASGADESLDQATLVRAEPGRLTGGGVLARVVGIPRGRDGHVHALGPRATT